MAKPAARSRVTASVDRDQWMEAKKMDSPINQLSWDKHAKY